MVNKWVNCGFPFDKFPFDLLGCIDINEFYLKYPDICMAIILEKNSLMESDLRIDLEVSFILNYSSYSTFLLHIFLENLCKNVCTSFAQRYRFIKK